MFPQDILESKSNLETYTKDLSGKVTNENIKNFKESTNSTIANTTDQNCLKYPDFPLNITLGGVGVILGSVLILAVCCNRPAKVSCFSFSLRIDYFELKKKLLSLNSCLTNFELDLDFFTFSIYLFICTDNGLKAESYNDIDDTIILYY